MKKNTPPIDWEAVLNINNHNIKLAEELIALFLKELPQTQELINTAADALDYNTLEKQAHKLQGACAYCGAHALKICASALELAASRKQRERISRIMNDFNQQASEVLTQKAQYHAR